MQPDYSVISLQRWKDLVNKAYEEAKSEWEKIQKDQPEKADLAKLVLNALDLAHKSIIARAQFDEMVSRDIQGESEIVMYPPK